VVVVSDREADFVAGQLAKTSVIAFPHCQTHFPMPADKCAARGSAHLLLGRKNQISRSPRVNAGGSARKLNAICFGSLPGATRKSYSSCPSIA